MTIHLCQELIEEIFERLPPKTLLRFRSLSKSWYSRISSPDFIHRHKSRSVEKDLIVHKTRYRDDEVEYIYTLHSEDQLPLCGGEFSYKDIMPVKIPGLYPEIVGSCNGIICMVDYSNDECRICLWNFSIRRKLIIPDHPSLIHPDIDPHDAVLGFGFDPITNDYKIVFISYCENKSFLYSMKTNSWREIPFFTAPFSIVEPNQACFVDGALHWVVKYHGKKDHFIMTFHLNSHVFGTITLPEPMWKTRQLTVINNSLAVISRYTDKYHSGVDNTCMWVMREYDNAASWSKVINLDMRNFEKAKVMKPITNGCLVFNTMGQWFKVYNHETRDLTRLMGFRTTCDDIETESYVESLELLDKGTSCGETISWTETTCRMFSYSYNQNNNGV